MLNIKGIGRIEIPIREKELTKEKVEPYLASIFEQFVCNSAKITKYYDKFLLNHDILAKIRPTEDGQNNKIIVPSLNSMINWKAGYVLGNPVTYAQTENLHTDDIKYLNQYVRGANKRAIDKEVALWVYATGVGYSFIEPNRHIQDYSNDAPFTIYCRPADSCCKVYSSYDDKNELFDLLYTNVVEIDQNGNKTIQHIIDLYFREAMYTYKGNNSDIKLITSFNFYSEQARTANYGLPLTEKRADPNGLGIVAKGEDLQYAIDYAMSNSVDNMYDIANEIYAYHNVDLGDSEEEMAESHKKVRKNGCIVLNTADPNAPASVDIIKTTSGIKDFLDTFNTLNETFHNSIGVPLEISNTNSGGTTKSGSEVANGYDNAYNVAINDVNTLIIGDREELNKILHICKLTPENKINELSANEIEIKYNFNLTDNILTKSQSYGTFIQTMPPAMALRLTRLSNDCEVDGKNIEDYMAKQKEQNTSKEVIDIKEGKNS